MVYKRPLCFSRTSERKGKKYCHFIVFKKKTLPLNISPERTLHGLTEIPNFPSKVSGVKMSCFHSSECSPGISLVCILVMKRTKMEAGLFWDLKLSIKRLLGVVVILETIFWAENSCRYSHGSVKYMEVDYKRARTWTS